MRPVGFYDGEGINENHFSRSSAGHLMSRHFLITQRGVSWHEVVFLLHTFDVMSLDTKIHSDYQGASELSASRTEWVTGALTG